MVSENEPTIPTNIAITSVMDDGWIRKAGKGKIKGSKNENKARVFSRQGKTRQVTYATPWHKDDAPVFLTIGKVGDRS
jgi:hypothetical protein